MTQATNLMKRITSILHKNGTKMIVGTDVGNPFAIYGFSTLDELENLVDAGPTPYEVLDSATVNAVQCLGIEAVLGKVKEGYQTGLLLLETIHCYQSKMRELWPE